MRSTMLSSCEAGIAYFVVIAACYHSSSFLMCGYYCQNKTLRISPQIQPLHANNEN